MGGGGFGHALEACSKNFLSTSEWSGGRGEGIQEKHLRDFTDAAQGSADNRVSSLSDFPEKNYTLKTYCIAVYLTDLSKHSEQVAMYLT